MKQSGQIICGAEDAKGQVCRLGPGHETKHRFGRLNLTERQLDFLELLKDGCSREFFMPAEARALSKHGLVVRASAGMRYWRVRITPAGFHAVQERAL